MKPVWKHIQWPNGGGFTFIVGLGDRRESSLWQCLWEQGAPSGRGICRWWCAASSVCCVCWYDDGKGKRDVCGRGLCLKLVAHLPTPFSWWRVQCGWQYQLCQYILWTRHFDMNSLPKPNYSHDLPEQLIVTVCNPSPACVAEREYSFWLLKLMLGITYYSKPSGGKGWGRLQTLACEK